MDVLLIKPPYTRLRAAGQAPTFPLGLGYIAAALEQNGFQTGIYNAEIPSPEDKPLAIDKKSVFDQRSRGHRRYQEVLKQDNFHVWKEIADLLRKTRPGLVGLSLLTVEAGAARKVSALVREILPETPVVWGGVHPTFCTGDCLRYPEVDYVIRGEGEEIAVALSRALISGKNSITQLKGVSFKENGQIRHNPPAEPMESLDRYPVPARHLLLNMNKQQVSSLGGMILSRGCPWSCSFCSSPQFWGRRVRFRSTRAILREMSGLIEEYGIRSFTFWDDSCTLNRKSMAALCRGILDRKIKATWKTATRIDLLDRDMLALMRNAGCIQLQLGIESGSPNMSKQICKEIDLSRVPDALQQINEAGIASGAFFMAGFPEETEEDLELTFRMIRELKSTETVLNIFDPMPGSPIFRQVLDLGLLQEPVDWCDFPLWPDRDFLSAMSREAFDDRVEKISAWIFQYNARPINFFRRIKPELSYFIKNDPLYLAGRIRRFLSHA